MEQLVKELDELLDKYGILVKDLNELLNKYEITVDEAVEIYKKCSKKETKRLIQHYSDNSKGVWSYLIKGENNPCGCGSNCFHYEYDKETNKIYGVCNCCNTDIYELNSEYIQEKLNIGDWK